MWTRECLYWLTIWRKLHSISGHSLEAAKNTSTESLGPRLSLWIHDYIFCGQSAQSTWSQEICQPPWAVSTTSSHNHTVCMQISFRSRESQRRCHYLRGLSQRPFFWSFFYCQCVIYKVLELEGKSQLGKQFGFVIPLGSTSMCPNLELQSHNTYSGRIQDGPKLLTFLYISCSLHIHWKLVSFLFSSLLLLN
jgi:hypothetical protein